MSVPYQHREEVEELAKRLKLRLFRTSVKEDFNVNEGQYIWYSEI